MEANRAAQAAAGRASSSASPEVERGLEMSKRLKQLADDVCIFQATGIQDAMTVIHGTSTKMTARGIRVQGAAVSDIGGMSAMRPLRDDKGSLTPLRRELDFYDGVIVLAKSNQGDSAVRAGTCTAGNPAADAMAREANAPEGIPEGQSKTELLAQVFELKVQLFKANEKLASVETDHTSAEEQQGSLAKRVEVLQSQNAELELELEVLRKNMNKEYEMLAMSEQRDRKRDRIMNVLREKQQLVLAEKDAALLSLKNEVAVKSRELDSANAKVFDLQVRLDQTQNRHSDLVRASQEQVVILQSQVVDEKGRNSQLEQELQMIKAELSVKQGLEVSTLKQELSSALKREREALDLITMLRASISDRQANGLEKSTEATPGIQGGKRKRADASLEILDDDGHSVDVKETQELIRGLRNEKRLLTELIASFSSSGLDAAEGLRKLHELKQSRGSGLPAAQSMAPTIASSSDLTMNQKLKDVNDKLEKELTDSSVELAQLKEADTQRRASAAKTEALLKASRDALRRAERRSMRLDKELAALHEQLRSYEEEVSEASSAGVDQRWAQFEKAKRAAEAHASELEVMLREKETAIAQYACQLVTLNSVFDELMSDSKPTSVVEQNALTSSSGRDGGEPSLSALKSMRSKLLESIRETSSLAKMSEIVKEQNQVLQASLSELTFKYNELNAKYETEVEGIRARLDAGEYDPETTKVIHFRSNPFSEALVQKLRSGPGPGPSALVLSTPQPLAGACVECERRKAHGADDRDDKLLSSVHRPAYTSTYVAPSLYDDEVGKLRDALVQTEKRAQRTREVARKKIDEFRVACYQLFGWKMQVNGAQYQLTSMFADHPNQILAFGQVEDNLFELLETEYCGEIQGTIDDVLKKYNSFPVFLAQVQMDNFTKTTSFVRQ